jgi:hypothetical protein
MNRKEIFEIHKKQLSLAIQGIRLAIAHNAVKGAEAEASFRQLMSRFLPRRYKLSSGFVINGEKVSNQHDLVVYDDFCNAPVYLGGNSGVFLGGSVYGVIEMTISKLNTKKLTEDIQKLANLRCIFPKEQVAFQKVMSLPLVDMDKVKQEVADNLSSGYSFDKIWPKIKQNLTEDGEFTGNFSAFPLEFSKAEWDKKLSELRKRATQFIVREKTIFSPPPPRTYLCALNGASYKTADSLAKTVYRLTKRYGAHIHGLLVLNEDGNDWLLSTKAYANYQVEVKTSDAFFLFIEHMKKALHP